MEKVDVNIIELLEYLQDEVDNAAKVPMSGKVMIDKREILEIVDQVINYLPDQLKKAEWIMNEKERILNEAKKEYDSVKKETASMMRKNIENHNIVKEAKIRAEEIIASAQRDAKAIRLGSRDYSDEILSQLDKEIENQKMKLITGLQANFENAANEIDKTLNDVSLVIKDNVKELRSMKK
ncbi:ATPase [uncultured Clostridium sp.]|uniref:ATPase n=1 Tax=uncultured Clostridium sp. TaxID=59620 RepID=UPI0025F35F76|nr:ATPase [uncultured Clostridium sp.]